MSVHAQYMVKCAGGGWLDPGRPLTCLGVSHKYASAVDAFRSAQAVGWAYDVATQEHRCPEHQKGASHVHHYRETLAAWPEGPDGELGTIKGCVCGATITESEGQ